MSNLVNRLLGGIWSRGRDKSIVVNTVESDYIQRLNEYYSSSFITFLNIGSEKEVQEYLTDCPVISSIMYRKTEAFLRGNFSVLDARTGNELMGVNKRWESILVNPNPLQSFSGFMGQVYYYTKAFGYCLILKNSVNSAIEGEKVSSLWVLPPNFTDIKFKKILPFNISNFYDIIESIKIKYNGISAEIDKESVFIFRDSTELRSDKYLPVSRISKVKYPASNIIKNYNTRGRLITKPYGLLSNTAKDNISTLPMDSDEKEALYREWSKYSTSDGGRDIVISNASLSWQSMMPVVRDLQLLELMKSDAAAICDVLGYEYDLLSRDVGGVALNNKNEANKLLYQNFIISEGEDMMVQLGKLLNADLNGIKFVVDYSHLPVFSEDKKFASESKKRDTELVLLQWDNYLITHDMMMTYLGLDIVKEYVGKYKYEMPYSEIKNNQDEEQNQGQGN